MGDKWRDIPGNSATYDRLCEAIRSGQAIAFIGAGASAGLYPLWPGLIRQLADFAVADGLADAASHAFCIDPKTNPQQAAKRIKEKLTEGTLRSHLSRIFAPRRGADGKYFTTAHGRLLGLAFRGMVTTNYDRGLLSARDVIRPGQPGAGSGYATWQDEDAVRHWHNQSIFDDPICPVLFAHGYYERSETLVLAADDYRAVYRQGQPFLTLMKALWGQHRLVFVGFGFSDSWLDFIAREAIGETGGHGAEARHFAIVGLPASEAYTPDMRRTFKDEYNASAMFYPVTRTADDHEDHSALLALLDELIKDTGGIGGGDAGSGAGGRDNGREDRQRDPSPTGRHRQMVEKALAKTEAFLDSVEVALKDEFGEARQGAPAITDFFAACEPGTVLKLFSVVSNALGQEDMQRLAAADRKLAQKAAAALYCLAACRLVDQTAVAAGLSREGGATAHLLRVNAGEPVICAIIATAVFGGELHLIPSDDPAMPRAEHGFKVTLDPGSQVSESDFERAVYLELFDGAKGTRELSLDKRPLTEIERGRLAARIRDLRGTRRRSLVLVLALAAPDAASMAEQFADHHGVPVVVPDSAAITALVGIDVPTLQGEIEEFWAYWSAVEPTG